MVGVVDPLGVELVVEQVAVYLKCKRHGVGQANARAYAVAGHGRDHVLVPEIAEIVFRVRLGHLRGAVVKAIGHAAAHEEEGAEHAPVIVSSEKVRQVEGQVGLALDIAYFVDFEGIHDIPLALPARGAEAQADDRRELIAERGGGSRGEKIPEGRFAQGVGSAALDLAVPVGVELKTGIGLALLCQYDLGTEHNDET